MEKVSSIFTVSSFPRSAATSVTFLQEPRLCPHSQTGFLGVASPFSAPEM